MVINMMYYLDLSSIALYICVHSKGNNYGYGMYGCTNSVNRSYSVEYSSILCLLVYLCIPNNVKYYVHVYVFVYRDLRLYPTQWEVCVSQTVWNATWNTVWFHMWLCIDYIQPCICYSKNVKSGITRNPNHFRDFMKSRSYSVIS